MAQGAILWLVIFVVLVILFVIVVRRMSVMVARTRDLERFQRQVAGLEARLAATVDPFVARLDEIRRRSGDPRDLANGLPAAQDTLRGLAAECRVMKVPAPLVEQASAFLVELERAARAADTVEHGLAALLADRGGRDLEAQTSLKRGTLNLRHAREAASRIQREVAGVRPADLLAPSGSVPRPPPGAAGRPLAGPAPATYIVDADIDPEGR